MSDASPEQSSISAEGKVFYLTALPAALNLQSLLTLSHTFHFIWNHFISKVLNLATLPLKLQSLLTLNYTQKSYHTLHFI